MKNKDISYNPKNLQQLRQDAGLTLQQLASAIGVTVAVMHRYEKGACPSIGVAVALARHFRVPVECVLGLTEIGQDALAAYRRKRTEAYEEWLVHGKRAGVAGDEDIIAAWPYNLYEDVFRETQQAPFSQDQMDGLVEALSVLTQREREFIRMVYQEEKRQEAVARELGVSRAFVHAGLQSAVRKLRHHALARMLKNGVSSALLDRAQMEAKNRCLDQRVRERLLARRQSYLAMQTEQCRERDTPPLPERPNETAAYPCITFPGSAGHIPSDAMDTAVTSLKLSPRARNCLLREGMDTVRDIITMGGGYLRDCRGMGTKTFREITEAVYQKTGVRLQWKDAAAPASDLDPDT